MLPDYAPWGGLEAYRREVTLVNSLWLKWEITLNLGSKR